jgi:hypothetical protein
MQVTLKGEFCCNFTIDGIDEIDEIDEIDSELNTQHLALLNINIVNNISTPELYLIL